MNIQSAFAAIRASVHAACRRVGAQKSGRLRVYLALCGGMVFAAAIRPDPQWFMQWGTL
jgi:hypothetical protein